MRRYSKRLEKTYGDEAQVEIFRSRDQIDRLFADSALIHRETYQHVLGVGFSDEPVQRALTELAMDRGWFRGYVLYLNGTPAAFWHGNAYKGVFGIGATGFDPAFADARPGTYLLMRVVEDLAAEGSVHTLDFGFGDAEYKRHFGDECRLEEDVVLVEPRAPAGRAEPGPLDGPGDDQSRAPRCRAGGRGQPVAAAATRAAGREGQAVTDRRVIWPGACGSP